MDGNANRTAAGNSRQTVPTSALDSTRSLIQQHGVNLATVTATLNMPTPLIRPSDRSIYLRLPENKAGLLPMIFKIPKARGFRRIDHESRALRDMFNRIRMTCKVWIILHDDPDPDHIVVWAEDEERLQDAFAALIRLIRLSDPDAEMKEQGMVTYLIYPPHDKETFVVTTEEISPDRHRFTAALVEGESLSDASRTHQASEFLHEFSNMAAILRHTPDKMSMRISLGTILLRQRPKRHELNLEEFEMLMQSVRKRRPTEFDEKIGNGEFGKSLIGLVLQCSDVFEGTETTDLALEHISPQYVLILIANGLHVEIEIVSDIEGFHYTPGKVYRIGQRGKLARINTFCPEKKFDWYLNVITECDTNIIPDNLAQFIQKIRPGKLNAQGGILGFPKPSFAKDTAVKAQVSGITGRSLWQFAICGTPYIMEVSIHHKWDPVNMMADPVVSCGLSIIGRRWDQEMTGCNTVIRERDWGDDFDRLFLDYEDRTGIESLLELVDMVQGIAGSIPNSSR